MTLTDLERMRTEIDDLQKRAKQVNDEWGDILRKYRNEKVTTLATLAKDKNISIDALLTGIAEGKWTIGRNRRVEDVKTSEGQG